MQIRERGGRIEFLRSQYDAGKKRSSQKMIGGIARYESTVPQALLDKMTEDEQAQATQYLKDKENAFQDRMMKGTAARADTRLGEIAEALEVHQGDIDEAKAASIYRGLDRIAKLLRKSGYTKSKVLV